MKLSYQSRQWLYKCQRGLSRADGVLHTLYQARGGGRVSTAVAAARLVGEGLDYFFPEMTPSEILKHRGYERFPGALGLFCLDTLQGSDLEKTEERLTEAAVLVKVEGAAWVRFVEAKARVHEQKLHSARGGDELWVEKGQSEAVLSAVRDIVWNAHSELQLTVRQKGFFSSLEGDVRGDWKLIELGAHGLYIAQPPLEHWVERLEAYQGYSRTLLLIGPSGVGKTVLVRLLAASFGHTRLLKITSSAIKRMVAGDLLDLVDALKPSVLLLDDVPLNDGGPEASDDWLALLEALHGRCRLTALTFMEDPGQVYRRGQGGEGKGRNSFGGIRPGRVDETARLKAPDKRIRRAILEAYGSEERLGLTGEDWDKLLEATQGLTGAYLRELVDRLAHHGTKKWQKEVESLLWQSPVLHSEGPRTRRGTLLTKSPRWRERRARGGTAEKCLLSLIKENQDDTGYTLTPETLQNLLAAYFSSYGNRKAGLTKTKKLLEKLEGRGVIEQKKVVRTIDGESEEQVAYALKKEE